MGEFNRSYQQRVVNEKSALDRKLAALHEFIARAPFLELPEDERNRLRRQAFYMAQYAAVLGERIDAFQPVESAG